MENGDHPAIDANGTIHVVVDYTELHALNPDGSTKWVFEPPLGEDEYICSPPSIGAGGIIYLCTFEQGPEPGEVFAIGEDE